MYTAFRDHSINNKKTTESGRASYRCVNILLLFLKPLKKEIHFPSKSIEDETCLDSYAANNAILPELEFKVHLGNNLICIYDGLHDLRKLFK